MTIQLANRNGLPPIDNGPNNSDPFPTIYLSSVSALPVAVQVREYDYFDVAAGQPVGAGALVTETHEESVGNGGIVAEHFTAIAPFDLAGHNYQFTFTDPDGSSAVLLIGRAENFPGGGGGGGGGQTTPQDPAHGWGDPDDEGPDPAEWLAATGESDRLRLFVDELDVTDWCTNLDNFLSAASRRDLDVSLPGVSATLRVLAPMAGATATLGLTVTTARATAAELAAEPDYAMATPLQRLAARQQRIEQVLARPRSLLKVVRWSGDDPFGNPGTRVAEAVCSGGRDWRPVGGVLGAGGHTARPKFTLVENSWREETPISTDVPPGADHVVVAGFSRGTAPMEDLDVTFIGASTLTDHATGVYLRSVAGAVVHCAPGTVTLDNGATMANTAWGGSGTPFLLTPGGHVSSTGHVRLYGFVRYAAGF